MAMGVQKIGETMNMARHQLKYGSYSIHESGGLYKVTFDGVEAHTLNPSDLSETPDKDGWIVIGEVHEDYFEWVNHFMAKHPGKGYVVFGDFENDVFANSKEAYEYFVECHPPHQWDYGDI